MLTVVQVLIGKSSDGSLLWFQSLDDLSNSCHDDTMQLHAFISDTGIHTNTPSALTDTYLVSAVGFYFSCTGFSQTWTVLCACVVDC